MGAGAQCWVNRKRELDLGRVERGNEYDQNTLYKTLKEPIFKNLFLKITNRKSKIFFKPSQQTLLTFTFYSLRVI